VEFGGSRNATVLIRWPQVAEDLYAEEQAADQLKGHYERNLLLFDEHLQLNQQCQRAAMEESQPQADDRNRTIHEQVRKLAASQDPAMFRESLTKMIHIRNIPLYLKDQDLLDIMTDMDLPLPDTTEWQNGNGIRHGEFIARFATFADRKQAVDALSGIKLHCLRLEAEYPDEPLLLNT
jgi:hypothetical protein